MWLCVEFIYKTSTAESQYGPIHGTQPVPVSTLVLTGGTEILLIRIWVLLETQNTMSADLH